MIKAEDKEIYRLWWEYLKRSERYNKFIESGKPQAPEVFPPKIWSGVENDLLSAWFFFGNVQKGSFEKWWRSTLKQSPHSTEIIPEYSTREKHILDANFYVKDAISRAYSIYKDTKAGYPTQRELINVFRELYHGDPFLIAVRYLHDPVEPIIKEFRAFLNKLLKTRGVAKHTRFFRKIDMYPTLKARQQLKARLKELQTYLDVYDLWKKGDRISKIAKELFKDDKREPQDIERGCRRDRDKAIKIISNVEHGDFPGKY
jgi:hypothetical protein